MLNTRTRAHLYSEDDAPPTPRRKRASLSQWATEAPEPPEDMEPTEPPEDVEPPAEEPHDFDPTVNPWDSWEPSGPSEPSGPAPAHEPYEPHDPSEPHSPSAFTSPEDCFTAEDFLKHWGPAFPMAADDFSQGLYPCTREKALERTFIEVNTSGKANLLVFDLDQEDALMEAHYMVGNKVIPPFQWVTENPETGHAHVGYVLADGVSTSAASRRAPQDYMRDVRAALTARMGADRAYSNFTTRNPLKDLRNTRFMRKAPYTLGELRDFLGDLNSVSVTRYSEGMATDHSSRHQTLFDAVRAYAHRTWFRYTGGDQKNRENHHKLVEEYAVQMNATQFAVPLPDAEVRSVVRSIIGWCWQNFSAEQFSEIQSERSRRRPVVQTKEERIKFLQKLVEQGEAISTESIVKMFNVSKRTAYNYLDALDMKGATPIFNEADMFRERVLLLHEQGHGYGAIAQATGKTREQVRYALRKAQALQAA